MPSAPSANLCECSHCVCQPIETPAFMSYAKEYFASLEEVRSCILHTHTAGKKRQTKFPECLPSNTCFGRYNPLCRICLASPSWCRRRPISANSAQGYDLHKSFRDGPAEVPSNIPTTSLWHKSVRLTSQQPLMSQQHREQEPLPLLSGESPEAIYISSNFPNAAFCIPSIYPFHKTCSDMQNQLQAPGP